MQTISCGFLVKCIHYTFLVFLILIIHEWSEMSAFSPTPILLFLPLLLLFSHLQSHRYSCGLFFLSLHCCQFSRLIFIGLCISLCPKAEPSSPLVVLPLLRMLYFAETYENKTASIQRLCLRTSERMVLAVVNHTRGVRGLTLSTNGDRLLWEERASGLLETMLTNGKDRRVLARGRQLKQVRAMATFNHTIFQIENTSSLAVAKVSEASGTYIGLLNTERFSSARDLKVVDPSKQPNCKASMQ